MITVNMPRFKGKYFNNLSQVNQSSCLSDLNSLPLDSLRAVLCDHCCHHPNRAEDCYYVEYPAADTCNGRGRAARVAAAVAVAGEQAVLTHAAPSHRDCAGTGLGTHADSVAAHRSTPPCAGDAETEIRTPDAAGGVSFPVAGDAGGRQRKADTAVMAAALLASVVACFENVAASDAAAARCHQLPRLKLGP